MSEQTVNLHIYEVTSVPSGAAAAVTPLSPMARQLVGDVMTRSVVSAGPDATLKQVAAAMTSPAVTTNEYEIVNVAARTAAHGKVRCLPVVDDNGVLVGIVTKSDLVKVFLRDDEAIRADIIEHVIGAAMLLERGTIDVEVENGVVRLSGELERKMLQVQLLERVRGVAGVIDIDNALTYRIDDSVVMRVGPVAGR